MSIQKSFCHQIKIKIKTASSERMINSKVSYEFKCRDKFNREFKKIRYLSDIHVRTKSRKDDKAYNQNLLIFH